MNLIVFNFFYSLTGQSVFADKLIVFLAVCFPYIVIVLTALFLIFYRKSARELFLVFFSSGVAWAVSKILKVLIHAERPFNFLHIPSLFPETGFSFPSTHAAFFGALAVAIFFVHKKTGLLFMFFALMIGMARIAGGVHFPVDILGGFAIGALLSYLARITYMKFAYFEKNV